MFIMKKLIALLILSLALTVSSIGQTAYARAYSFAIGSRDYSTNELVWNGTPTACNILIKIEGDVVTVFSKQKQVYHVVTKLNETADGVQYRMLSDEGVACNMYMGPIEGTPNMFIAIEYNDYAWIYSCTDETK
jgi:hypothetical protein